MNAIRYSYGFVLAIASSVAIFIAIASIAPAISKLSAAILAPTIAAGIVGGFVAGLFAPKHKLAFSACVGFAFAGTLLGIMVTNDFQLGQRNPLYWYWPAWLVPGFVIGGLLSRRFWCVAV